VKETSETSETSVPHPSSNPCQSCQLQKNKGQIWPLAVSKRPNLHKRKKTKSRTIFFGNLLKLLDSSLEFHKYNSDFSKIGLLKELFTSIFMAKPFHLYQTASKRPNSGDLAFFEG